MSFFYRKNNQIHQWLPRLQSHRGYCQNGAVENTLESIQQAFKLGYQMVEFDVRITQDNVLILHHDESFLNFEISRSLFQTIQNKKAISTLEEVLSWLSNNANKSLKLNIELKSKSIFQNKLESETVQLIQKYNLQKQVLISSFNPFSLFWVRVLDSSIYRALLVTQEIHPDNKWVLKKRLLNFLAYPDVLNLDYQDFEAEEFQKLTRSVPIVLWTCNDLVFFNKTKEKIFGIISDQITPNEFELN